MRKEFGLVLAIVDNGFVYVGKMHHEDGYYVVTNCANVRKAGTERGFGEIAFGGPTKETVLDYCPHILVPEGRMCHIMVCAGEKWAKHIKE